MCRPTRQVFSRWYWQDSKINTFDIEEFFFSNVLEERIKCVVLPAANLHLSNSSGLKTPHL